MGSDHPRRLGQTETTLRSGNTPGQPVKGLDGPAAAGLPGGAGRPATGDSADEGEICSTSRRPVNLMTGYVGDHARTPRRWPTATTTPATSPRGTRTVPHLCGPHRRRVQGKRLQGPPFELESVLIEHPAVAEAAVVPAPDVCGWRFRKPTWRLRRLARRTGDAPAHYGFARERLAPYQNVRRSSSSNFRRRFRARSGGSTARREHPGSPRAQNDRGHSRDATTSSRAERLIFPPPHLPSHG